jgi:hypothetical protein
MRKSNQILLVLLIFAATFTFAISQRNNPTRNRSSNPNQRHLGNQLKLIMALPLEELSATEVEAIQLMREEEKMARDVYLSLYEKWQLPIFWNIAGSEQRHMDAVGVLIEKYQLADSASGVTGEFNDENLQSLYGQLTAQGEMSLADALRVGATIEDLDIFDLKGLLESVDNTDIRTVFQNLLSGSENHMRAFIRQLSQNGETYEAQYISGQELDEILSVNSGRGGRGSRGQGGMRGGRRFGSGVGDGNGKGDGTCPYGN